MSAVDVLAEAGGAPEAAALATPEGSWTFAELDAEVDGRAAGLRERGVEPGEVVPLVVEPDAQAILSLLAHWRVGAVPAPLNARLTEAERAAATAALTHAPEGAQAVVWTSGTEGRPRGVALSFEALAASARASRARLDLGADDVWLASLSPAHVGGLALLTRTLLIGSCLVAVGRFDIAAASGLIDGEGLPPGAPAPVTHASLVPTHLHRLVDHRRGAPPPDTFRCALIGGAHAPADLVARALRAGWPLALTYGATEMTSQIATAAPERTRAKPGTAGTPLQGVEVRVAGDGEILARGATQAIAYVCPAGESAPALRDADGWYHTGDLGRIDDEGDLWVTGRRSDRIVSGGVTIDAVEVEEALRGHPAVLDACVVGVPDAEWGERVAALVVPVVGEFDVEDVERDLRAVLSPAKVPRVWHEEGALPLGPSGKVDRAGVRALLASRRGAPRGTG